MSDPLYNAVPTGGYSDTKGICPNCGGVEKDFIGFEGEYPCQCGEDDVYEAWVDSEIERRLLERKEGKHNA